MERLSEDARGYPCRCCGFLTLADPRNGSYEICPVCYWEDDPVQNEDPLYEGGANRVSLNEAKKNFVLIGASEAAALAHVRGPKLEEVPRVAMLGGLDSETREAKARGVKTAILGTVRSVKTGRLPLLDGCVTIAEMSWQADGGRAVEECFLLFRGVASECDGIPSSAVRRFWAPAALAEKDAHRADFEERIRPTVMAACDRLEKALLAEL